MLLRVLHTYPVIIARPMTFLFFKSSQSPTSIEMRRFMETTELSHFLNFHTVNYFFLFFCIFFLLESNRHTTRGQVIKIVSH